MSATANLRLSKAHYHPRHLLARVVFALEAIYRAELRKIGTEVPPPLPDELGFEVESEIARLTNEFLPENPTEAAYRRVDGFRLTKREHAARPFSEKKLNAIARP